MTAPSSLAGRVYVVTGGTRGIGAAIAQGLLDVGARVCVLARDPDPGDGEQTLGVPVDLAEPATVAAAFDRVVAAWGRIDGLVNNAGISKVGPTLEYDLADFARILDVNVTGLFACSQAAARVMAKQGGGSIVSIASMTSFTGQPQRAAYIASKSAVLGLTRALANDWGPLGIRVNAVAPGYIRTDLTGDLIERGVLDVDAIAARAPLGRFGQPADVVGAVLFLLSDQAGYTTGQAIVVDGGWTVNGYFK
ncbi:3-oxoacyl-ACP reductase family protein [Micromonospora sp. FIMYZ51]|uniref:SDR family NAD(P)-dependent oxidoreductase n=1 Tax=Micromonospora sp. FIMYZ51 TaxID=3051832 RepID=UPI00311FDADE